MEVWVFIKTKSTYGIFALLFAGLLTLAGPAAAEDMDPLLRLLVAKGVISQEEAVALQAESKDLARTSHRSPTATGDVPQSVAFAPLGVLDGLPSTTPRPSGRKHNISQHLSGLETNTGEKCGLEEKNAAPAPVAPAVENKTLDWTDRVDFGGDIRLRYEGFSKDGSYDDGRRDRFRIRLRAGIEAAVTDWMKVGIEMRNGDPADPVSNNTTFEGGFQFKEFNLAEGYLEIHPQEGFGLIAGKFDAKKWWTVSDFQWDDDVTVEGVLTNVELASGGGVFKNLDLVAYGFLLEEVKEGPDANLYGGQLRSNFRVSDAGGLKLGVGFDAWKNPQRLVDLTFGGDLRGNSVTNLLTADGRLVSDFEILNLFAEYKHSASNQWPLKFSVYYYQNLGAEGPGRDNDTGYYGRIQVGDSKKMWQSAFRYTYYYSEPDALFYLFSQSDTGRGSDAEAHRFDYRLGFAASSYFNLTWYTTKPVSKDDETISRWQLDYIVRF